MPTYATVDELNDYLPAALAVDTEDDDEVAEAVRLLARASELVDDRVRARYSVDTEGAPNDATIAAALRDATVRQYEHWIEVDEANAIDGLAVTPLAVAGYTGQRAPALWPRAAAVLKLHGLHLPVALGESLPPEDDGA